jgi:hypothetical protein
MALRIHPEKPELARAKVDAATRYATVGHAQGASLSSAQAKAIVDFELRDRSSSIISGA